MPPRSDPTRNDPGRARRRSALALVVALAWGAAWGQAGAPARQAVEDFGRALVGRDAAALRALLPERGHVGLKLDCLGPEEGTFSPRQVEALLLDFLAQGSIRSFRVVRVEQDPRGGALARCRADGTDRDGHPVSLELHLALLSEDGRWVLREIRESPP